MDQIQATREMCFYCFETLIEYFHKNNNRLYKRSNYSLLDKIPNYPECSLFVSWKKTVGQNSELRGCKGNLGGGISLHEGLKYYAIISGSADRRFESLTEDEIPFLSCSVSLLFDFETSADCYDWILGEHGIRIDFVDQNNKERTATFLPQVPVQCGWTKKHTIKRLIQKSGCTDKIEFDANGMPPKHLKLKTVRYRSSLANATHQEYQQNHYYSSNPSNGIIPENQHEKIHNKTHHTNGTVNCFVRRDTEKGKETDLANNNNNTTTTNNNNNTINNNNNNTDEDEEDDEEEDDDEEEEKDDDDDDDDNEKNGITNNRN